VNSETSTGLSKVEVIRIDDARIGEAAVEYVPAEAEFKIVVNGRIETALHCAPHRIKSLIVGWLIGEGVIDRESDFVAIDTDLDQLVVRVTIGDEGLARRRARGDRELLRELHRQQRNPNLPDADPAHDERHRAQRADAQESVQRLERGVGRDLGHDPSDLRSIGLELRRHERSVRRRSAAGKRGWCANGCRRKYLV
jgi:formate dehydrogenase assembly factor FdhD